MFIPAIVTICSVLVIHRDNILPAKPNGLLCDIPPTNFVSGFANLNSGKSGTERKFTFDLSDRHSPKLTVGSSPKTLELKVIRIGESWEYYFDHSYLFREMFEFNSEEMSLDHTEIIREFGGSARLYQASGTCRRILL